MIINTRRAAAVLVAGFFLITAGLVYWQVIRSQALAANPGNPRSAERARTNDRGRFLDRNGKVLAESRVLPDGTRVRSYSTPSLAQTIGYVSTRFGVSGLEQTENAALDGSRAADPAHQALQDLFHQTGQGDNVVLTIDSTLQQAAAAALAGRNGAVVVLDPHSGAVLAMASSPTFDAAQIDTIGDRLNADPSHPLLNRATQGLYPPGSVYKIVTASAALDSGVVKPADPYRCVNGVVVEGFVIQCENAPPGRTEWDFQTAFAYSINATFAQVAIQLGSDRFLAYSRRFGMDGPLRLEIDTATSTTSRGASTLGPVALANSGFGQGQLSVTPLQMALVGATIANGGVEPDPYLVQQILAPSGAVVQDHGSGGGHRVIASGTASEMTQFMLSAVGQFGSAAGLTGLDVAGKTGTAETGTGATAHSWFVGFTPSASPAIVVAAVVENGGPGSQAAAPIAAAVFRAYNGH